MPPKKKAVRRRAGKNVLPDETTVLASSIADVFGEDDSGSSRPQPEAKRDDNTRKQTLSWTTQQQDDIILWFQENEHLYDKGHTEYKLTNKKKATWKDKAEELGLCDGPRLKIWVDSIRTQYGKLTRLPSGSGVRLSVRDKWILEKLSFLSKHIYRIPSRGGVNLIAKLREKHQERIPASGGSGEEEENKEDNEEEQIPSTSPSMLTSSGEQGSSTALKRKKKTREEDSTALLHRLQERIQKSSQLQEKLVDQLSVPTDPRVAERRQWAQWFGTAIMDIDDSLWSKFQTESLQLVNTFKTRPKRVQQANEQSPPLQVSPMQSADQERVDYDTARRVQTFNYSSNPGGYLPIWQQAYQPPPRPVFPPPAYVGRPQSEPLATKSTLTTMTFVTVSSIDNAGPKCGAIQATPTGESTCTGGRTDSLRELMKYSGIPAVDLSCESVDV